MNDRASILVVDDSSESLSLLVRILGSAGYEVRPADSGELALSAVAVTLPDLILMDVRMRGLDGLEVCRRLKENEGTRHIPVILVSALSDVSERVKGLRVGAVDYLTKPFQEEELLTRIKVHLALSRAHTSLARQAAALRQVNEQLQSEILSRRMAEDELRRQNIGRAERSRRALLSTLEDQKRTETALRESERKYRELAENINDALYTLDIQGMVTYIGPSVKTFSGYDPRDIIGRSFSNFVRREDMPGLERSFKDTLNNRLEPWEFRYLARNGQTRWARTSSRPIVENGNVVGLRGILSDITRQKEMEEELIKAHKLDSLGILAGGIAHDFNNILTGIKGNISVVRHSMAPTDTSSELLAEAENAVLQAKNLTLQLLTFSKGGAPVKQRTALPELLKEAVTFASRGSKIRTEFRIDPAINLLNADPGQIMQVIHNIVINSVQAMPNGGDLFVSAGNMAVSGDGNLPLESGQYIRIAFRDTGIGISTENIGKVFDPYFTTKQTGSGLGLAACYSIIKNHDGYITVESEIGKGSSFVMYLPAYSGPVEAVATSAAAEIKKGSGRVLVLDDEQRICTILQRMLSELGYSVECFPDSDHIVARYRETWNTPDAFDVAILDLTVPGGKGGKEAIGQLREINPGIKAVVSSGYSNDPVVANYKKFGFSAILPKPFDMENLSEVLQKLLG